jgi:hypothetical protein
MVIERDHNRPGRRPSLTDVVLLKVVGGYKGSTNGPKKMSVPTGTLFS